MRTEKKSLFGRDALAFLAVGGSAAVAYVCISSFVLESGTFELSWPDWIVSGLIYAAFVPVVYFAHRIISFRSDVPHGRAFPRYVTAQILGLGVATALSFFVYQMVGLPAIFGSAIVIGLTSLFNYFVLRGWTFSTGVSE